MNYSTEIYLRDAFFELVVQRLAARVSKHKRGWKLGCHICKVSHAWVIL